MSSTIKFRVLEANTGVSHTISLSFEDINVNNIKQNLADVVPLRDQILLLGPPYKIPKDSTIRSKETINALSLGDLEDSNNADRQGIKGSLTNTAPSSSRGKKRILSTTERSGARRLFLFSKRSLSESAPDPEPCVLQPTTVALPTEPDPSPISFPTSSIVSSSTASTSTIPTTSPLHQALQVYERRLMLELNRAQVLTSTSHLRLQSLQTCLAEQTIICLALRAAVSNLSDHRNSAHRTSIDLDSEYERKCGAGSKEYKMLQDGALDHVLNELGNISLHARLVELANIRGRRMETLVDTVMVERERNWWMRCRDGHDGLESLYKEVKASFGNLADVGNVGTEDSEEEKKIEALIDEVEEKARNLRDKQVERLEKLTEVHRKAVDVIGFVSSGDGASHEDEGGANQSHRDGERGRVFVTLEEMSKASEGIVPQMEEDDADLLKMMEQVASHKTDAMKRMKMRLRQVSLAQSAIQKVLSQVSVLREALDRWCVDVSHMEHVQELPTAYRDFMAEVRRRRAYGEAVAATSGAMIERLAYMRDEEVKMREIFLRGPGRHLMPPFFDVFVPTLVSAPPLFAPQYPAMVEMNTLPDFGSQEEMDSGKCQGLHEVDVDGTLRRNVPSLSPDDDVSGTISDASMERSSPNNGSGTEHDNAVTNTSESLCDQDSLIVSAGPTSTNENDNDIIMAGTNSSHNTAAETCAKKTLAYENSVLRQEIERLGGKLPRVYVEEAQERDRQKRKEEESELVRALQTQLDKAQKQLTQYKTNLDRANNALNELRSHSSSSPQLCDKISHSNIQVGDVALFMPTSSREKRDYLAFHSNCPRKYLNTDTIEGNPDYVLGRIVIQERLVAGAKGTDANPYGLKVGTTFWVLTVEVIKVQVPSTTSAVTNASS